MARRTSEGLLKIPLSPGRSMGQPGNNRTEVLSFYITMSPKKEGSPKLASLVQPPRRSSTSITPYLSFYLHSVYFTMESPSPIGLSDLQDKGEYTRVCSTMHRR